LRVAQRLPALGMAGDVVHPPRDRRNPPLPPQLLQQRPSALGLPRIERIETTPHRPERSGDAYAGGAQGRGAPALWWSPFSSTQPTSTLSRGWCGASADVRSSSEVMLFPASATMVSPCWRPASSAGEFDCTSSTSALERELRPLRDPLWPRLVID